MVIDLWLDDVRDPGDPRIQELFGAEPGMVWVKSAHAAISRLKSGNVRSISLDHDLGQSATGHDVARWIEERSFNGELARISWNVHSTNIEGARAICATLQNADRFWSERENLAGVQDIPHMSS